MVHPKRRKTLLALLNMKKQARTTEKKV